MRYKTGHDPVENARQEKMVFVDVEKFIKDGVEYTVTYQSSGIISCEAPEPEVNIPEPEPGWVSYKMSFSVSPFDIKVSPR